MSAFTKIESLGNDVIVIDRREGGDILSPEEIAKIADRKAGIGADKVITVYADDKYGNRVEVFNNDGSKSFTSINLAYCMGCFLDCNSNKFVIDDIVVHVNKKSNNKVVANIHSMKVPTDNMPSAEEAVSFFADDSSIVLTNTPVIKAGMAPHIIYFVGNVKQIDIKKSMAKAINKPLFKRFLNTITICFVEVIDEAKIYMRLWENNLGEVASSSFAAVLTYYAAKEIGMVNENVNIHSPGGEMKMYMKNGNMYYEGRAKKLFSGIWMG